ncbi:MAG: nucleotidyltransferase domain-containing protein [Chloroflexota bacterium]|nr:nucleotidyltransferase domain-containing protein [Chloroflexota bacterium]
MTPDRYLRGILLREHVDASARSPVLGVQRAVNPILRAWAGRQLVGIAPSGSFAKGTASRSGTDIDLFVSLSSSVTMTLEAIYESLFSTLHGAQLAPQRQNVSIGIRVGDYDVDVVPAKRQGNAGNDHSLYRRRAGTWTKTNVARHISEVRRSGRTEEIRVIKLWRDQSGLEFPSFYLELTVIDALAGKHRGNLAANVWAVFAYLRDRFPGARVVDPANTSNTVSDDLTAAEKAAVTEAAQRALAAKSWGEIVS